LGDENGVFPGGELENAGDDGAAVVDEAFVDFVGEEPEMVAAGEIEKLLLLFECGDPAERVRGRGLEEQAGARGDRAFRGRD